MQGKQVYTVNEFCDAFALSRSYFYQLVAEGRGPTLLKVGRKTLVPVDAADDWRRERLVPARRFLRRIVRTRLRSRAQ
jgi:excisionase family DNA binding protein